MPSPSYSPAHLILPLFNLILVSGIANSAGLCVLTRSICNCDGAAAHATHYLSELEMQSPVHLFTLLRVRGGKGGELAALFDNGKAAEEAANRARKQAFRKRRFDAKQRRQQQRFQQARVPHTKAEAGESTESSDTDSMGTPKYGYLTEPFDDPPAGCHEPADLYSPVECFYRQRQLRAEERSGVGSVAPGFGDADSKLHLLDIPSAKYDINLLPLLYKLVRESASALQIRLGVREVVKTIRMQQEKPAGGHIQARPAKIQSACAVCALVIFAEDVQDEPSFVSLDELAALCHANKIQTLMVPISNIRTHIVTTHARGRAHTHTHTHTHLPQAH